MRKPAPAVTALLVALAFLSLLPALRAARQSDQEIASILTTGQWRVMQAGRMLIRTFKSDGTYSSTPFQGFGNPQAPAPAGGQDIGTWIITDSKIILRSADNSDEQNIPLPINPGFVRVTDKNGAPMMMIKINTAVGWPNQGIPTPPPTPTPTPPISADEQQSASALVQTYHDSLVFATGKEGSGSGFIAAIGKANYLVTNAHVVAEIRDASFKTLDGTVVQGDPASLAVGEDICCMQLPAGGRPFQIMQHVDQNAAIGDDVVVLGNAEGEGVVNTIIGKIVGIGPNLVEIDAPFVPGNSGSPIIHLKTGEVVGIATYTVTKKYDLTTDQKLQQPVIRRFGYRLDSVKGWQPVNWRAFNYQAAQMQSIDGLTADLYDFFRDLDENKGRVTPDRHNNPVIKARIDEWLEAKGHHHSEQDRIDADANLIAFLKNACQNDVAAAQRQISYDYFVRDLTDQQQTRGEMVKAFQEILRAEGQ